MFRINQVQQENTFLMEQHMACHNTLQLWMEDYKKLEKENQELKRQLKVMDLDWKSMVKATEYLVDRTEGKQKHQEEKLKFLAGELKRSDEVRRVFKAEMDKMRELLSFQKKA